MSLMQIQDARIRIKTTLPESPIAVFATPETYEDATDLPLRMVRVDTVPASTLNVQRRIARRDPHYLGTFDKRHSPREIEATIREAIHAEPATV